MKLIRKLGTRKNKKGYYPENCHFVTHSENQKNKGNY